MTNKKQDFSQVEEEKPVEEKNTENKNAVFVPQIKVEEEKEEEEKNVGNENEEKPIEEEKEKETLFVFEKQKNSGTFALKIDGKYQNFTNNIAFVVSEKNLSKYVLLNNYCKLIASNKNFDLADINEKDIFLIKFKVGVGSFSFVKNKKKILNTECGKGLIIKVKDYNLDDNFLLRKRSEVIAKDNNIVFLK